MSFVSLQFLALFAVVVPLYFALPHRMANVVLLIASYVFYAYWQPVYLLLLLFTMACDYRLALAIDASDRPTVRRALLATSLGINFGILFVFKYGFWVSAASLPLLLPIGISFYTFQEVSYVMDVYRRRLAAAARFTELSLFISFFPQLIAGPIERAGEMLPQFATKHPFTEENAVAGLRLILLGFFKKLVIADRVAAYVDTVYATPSQHIPATLLLATVFFGIQIYADFSAYSDIAIGTARVLGFRLMINFRQPYFSGSVSEFWRRWHISLSTWFRDYVYIPLGGNRVSRARRCLNVLAAFLLSGLWHGAHVKFVMWGALHGLAVIIEDLFSRRWVPRWARLPEPVGRLTRHVATLVFVCFAWVPFRAESLRDCWYIWRHLIPDRTSLPALAAPAGGRGMLAGMVLVTVSLVVIDALDSREILWPRLAGLPRPWRWAVYYAASYSVLSFGAWGQHDFIYFQF